MRLTKWLILIVLTIIPIFSYAEAPDIRISDNDGQVLDVTTAKKLTATTTAPTASTEPYASQAPVIRITDNDGDILEINADGSINVTSI